MNTKKTTPVNLYRNLRLLQNSPISFEFLHIPNIRKDSLIVKNISVDKTRWVLYWGVYGSCLFNPHIPLR